MKPAVYEGSEPYIFVSYAHRDAERVFEVLRELEQRGYRLWYDDGIAPGSEWPEDIARHLDGAAMVMAFVTNNSMASRNCRREINFSLSREKPFLSVVLEETEMPLGMEMQLSAQQSIIRYNYDSWEGFVGKILQSPDLVGCRREVEVEQVAKAYGAQGLPAAPAAEPVPEPQPEPAAEPVQPAAVVPVPAAEPQVTQADVPAPQPVEAVVERVEPAPELPAPARRSKMPLVVTAVALLVVALVAVFALTRGPSKVAFSWGSEVLASSGSVVATGKAPTAEDWEAICSLESLRTLALEGCDLSACDFAGAVAQGKLAGLKKLDLSGATGISDYGFLASLPLEDLNLSGCADFSDLSVLDAGALRTLDVSGTGVADLAPLEGTGLTSISFADTAVADLAPLAGAQSLASVDGTRSAVTSLKPLAQLEDLETIAFDGCALDARLPQMTALRLAKVHLAGTGVSDAKGLADCTKLRELDLSGNERLSSIAWLDAQNYETLERLDLSQTGLGADDLGWLGECASLKELRLDGIDLADLAFCKNMEGLETISAVNCGIADISGLAGCPKLEVVLLACNGIADVAPLAGLEPSRDTIVDLSYNALTSLEGLATGSYRALLLYGNDEAIADTIPADAEAYVVVAPWYDGVGEGPLAEHGSFSSIYLLGCPKNQQLETEEALWEGYTTFLDEDALWDLYANDGFEYPLGQDFSYFLSLQEGGLKLATVAPTIGL